MKAISLTQALLMSLTIGVAFSAHIATRNMCTGKQDGDSLPNHSDCSSYYVCNYGVPHLFNCSLDLLFDVDLNVCNWPKDVSCKQVIYHPIQPVHPPQNLKPTSLPAVNGSSVASTTVGWAPLPPNWPHAPSAPHHDTIDLPDGIPDDGWVADGWTDDGWVDDDVVQPVGETVSTTAKPSTNPAEFYPGIVVKSINPTTFACSRDDFYFAPHPTSCQKYFICSNRQLHEHQCGSGIQWDYIRSQCEHIERATCFGRAQQQLENGSFTGSVPAHHEVEPIAVESAEDGTEGVLDPEFGVTDGTIDPDQSNAEEIDPEYTATPDLSDASDVENETTSQVNNGTNDEIDPGFTAIPQANGTGNDPEYTVTPPTHDNDLIYTVGVPEWDNVPDSNEVSNDGNLPKCPKKEQAFIPHAIDCTKYYICISGEAILTKCPESLTWDDQKSECVEDRNKCIQFKE